MPAKRLALAFLAAGSPVILLSLLVRHPLSEALFGMLVVAFPVALIAVGAAHNARLGPLRRPLLVFVLWLEACVLGMLALRGQVLEAPWLGGLPLAAAIQLYGVWLAPLVLVSLAYALTFESFGLRQQDLERLRRLRRWRDGDKESGCRFSANP